MSNDRDDDNPIGWRSIYSDDDRKAREEDGRTDGGSEEERPESSLGAEEERRATVTEPEELRESGWADAGTKRETRSFGSEESRETLVSEPAEGRETRLPESNDESSVKPAGDSLRSEVESDRPSSERPDVGYPREFPAELEEEKPRKQQKQAAGQAEGKAAAQVRYRKKKGHPLLWSFFIALGLVLIAGCSVLFYVWNGLRPTSGSATPVRVTIAKGMDANRISEELEQSGLIRNAYLFSVWLKFKNEGAGFQAGDYEMNPGITREEIVAKLNAGDTVAAATVKFTIPEGFTVTQIADRLAKDAGINKDKFLQEMKDPAILNASMWTKQIPADAKLTYPLEGYLFPETYEMKKGSSEEDIINRMVAELDRKLGELPEDWQSAMEERGLTLHQLLTIASLVEREVVLDDERGKVASVIENRLEKKMPLQIDATIQYALGKQKEKLSTDDLKVDSPYNTYLNPGLPPGPIANPSLKSIEAALYPDDTDYLYYVTKKDGSNQHLFATTYKQHQKNIQISEQNEKKTKQ